MSIDLEKQVKKAGIVLTKRDVLKVPPVRVGVVDDVSGSTLYLHQSGQVQSVLSRLLALAINFDDDGELDTWVFDNQVFQLPTMTRENHENYVRHQILDSGHNLWNGTSYAPAMEAALQFYFPEVTSRPTPLQNPSFLQRMFGLPPKLEVKRDVVQLSPPSPAVPAMCLFITDGQNDDEKRAERVLETSQEHPLYWQLVGIGDESFSFIRRMADKYPNVGFVNFSHLDISDEDLYDQLISQELADWVKTR